MKQLSLEHLLAKQWVSVFVLSAIIFLTGLFFSGNSFAADSAIEKKLIKCETAFELAQSGKLSQKEAWLARREHKKLASEILADLNKRNAKLSTISNEEILSNLKVMGRLLEMLATDHPAVTDEWGYPLIR